MSIGSILCWLGVVVAVEATTEILVASKLFAPLRGWIARRAIPDEPLPVPPIRQLCWAKLSELWGCGYCMSVWVAFFYCLLLGTARTGPVDNLLVCALIQHRLSNWLHVVTQLVTKGRVFAVDLEVAHKTDVKAESSRAGWQMDIKY